MKNNHILSSMQKDLVKQKTRGQTYSRIFLLLIALVIVFFVSRSNEYQIVILGISLAIGIVVLYILPQKRVFVSPEEIHKKIEERIAFLEEEKKSAEANKKTKIDKEEDDLREILSSIDHPEQKKS